MPDHPADMPIQPDQLEAIRYEVIKAWLDILRAGSQAWMGEDAFWPHIDQIFLIGLIYLENYERRGAKAAALAASLGAARTTVERRLDEMAGLGFVERRPSGIWLTEASLRQPINTGMILSFAASIRRCHEAIVRIKPDLA